MKKIISKILIIFIIIVMLFEFVISSNICNAAAIPIDEDFVNTVTNLAGGVVSIVYWPKRFTAVALAFIMDILTAQVARESGINESDGLEDFLITPFNIFFNKYKLLDVNFFDINESDSNTIIYTFRVTVANWYYVMRLIALIILMVILIYVGIRMALSTMAEDKAKYKKMLIDWCCSLALVFILHYIAIFIIYCNDAIVAALKDGITDLNAETQLSGILTDIGLRGVLGIGITSIAAVLVFVFIVFQTIAFLLAYINRVIKVGFLLIISPLITLTYSIDKMGDGKAQALGAWLKEFVYTILIQPFHCIMYMAFVRPAITLLVGDTTSPLSIIFGSGFPLASPEYNQLVNGILAILCLKFINDGEKIVRKIFGFQDDNSSTSMAAGMAVGMMAVKNAQKMGMTARKGINSVRNTASRFSENFNIDAKTFSKSDNPILRTLGKGGLAVEKTAGKVTGAVGKAQKAVTNNRAIRGVKSISGRLHKAADKGGVKGFMAKQMLKHNSLSSTLGMMGAAMAYSTGSTDALTAIGTGSAIQKGSQELFSSSDNSCANAETNSNLDEYKKDGTLGIMDDLSSDIKSKKAKLEHESDETYDAAKEYKKYKQLRDKAKSENEKADEMKKNNSDEIEEAQKRIDDLKKSGSGENDSKIKKEMKKIEELEGKKYRDKAKKLNEEADNINAFDGDRNKENKDRFSNLYKDEEKLEDMSSLKNIKKRIQQDRIPPKKSELQAKKNQIISELTQLMLNEKYGLPTGKEGDNKQERTLTMSETDTIEKTAEMLITATERGVLTGKGISENTEYQRNLIGRNIGIRDENTLSKIFSTTSEYESLQRRKIKAETYKRQAQYGGDSERLEDIEAQKTQDALRRRLK